MYEGIIRWAIVGTGYIANRFAQGLGEVHDAMLAGPTCSTSPPPTTATTPPSWSR